MAHINCTKIKTKLRNDMNEASLNERDAKGQWQPRILPNNAPLYKWPPKPASIMRARRAIQQEIPSLRGISHKMRQDKQEEVKKEVKELRYSLQ